MAQPYLVKAISTISWDSHNLSRVSTAVVVVGKKAFFVENFYNIPGGLLEIYNSVTDTWSSINYEGDLRQEFAATKVGSKVLIGGGNASIPFSIVYNSVDIYDDLTGRWNQSYLNTSRSQLAATTLGCKAFFAGGVFPPTTFSTVDIYDSIQDGWTVNNLSSPRYGLAATTANGKAYFAGGYKLGGPMSNVVDIYDLETDSWSVAFLSIGRMDMGATRVGSNIMFAGGETGNGRTDIVDIYNTTTNTWSVSHLTSPFPTDISVGNSVIATTVGDLAFFWVESSEYVDIYDSTNDSWSFELRGSGNRSAAAGLSEHGFFVSGTNVEIASVYPAPQETVNENPTMSVGEYVIINNALSVNGSIQDEDSCNWLIEVDYGDGSGIQEITRSEYDFELDHLYTAPGIYQVTVTLTDDYHNETSSTVSVSIEDFLTELQPAKVWVGLKNSDDVGIRFDLLAEAYKDNSLIAFGQLDSISGGGSGFNNANLHEIPLTVASPVDFSDGSTLRIKLYARNACSGSGKNNGHARLWFNDSAANTRFGSTIAGQSVEHYLLSGFTLGSAPGSGPKAKIDILAGAKCSNFKLFGIWQTTP